jgi:hypothetical protein
LILKTHNFQNVLIPPFTSFISVCGGLLTYHVIPKFREMFITRNLFGVDLNKSSGIKAPEVIGVITGCILLMVILIMIPFTYSEHLLEQTTTSFPHVF